MTLPAYPSSIMQPSIDGFSLQPKESKKSMMTARGGYRFRKSSNGHRYEGTISLVFNSPEQRNIFLEWLRYDINYSDYWFNADWFGGIDFQSGEWLFKFTSLSFVESGYYSKFTLPIIMRPVYYVDQYSKVDTFQLVTTQWPNPNYEFSEICELTYGGVITNDDEVVTYDGDPVTEFPELEAIIPDEITFDWGGTDIDADPEPVSPLTGDIRWVNILSETYQAGDNFFSADSTPPTTSLWGITKSGTDGSICNKPLTPKSESYLLWTNFDTEIADAIAIGSLQVGFACQHLFRTTNLYPRVWFKLEFRNCVGTVLFGQMSQILRGSGSPTWQEVSIKADVPKGTTEVRVYFDQKRGDGALTGFYSRIDNIILAYQTCSAS